MSRKSQTRLSGLAILCVGAASMFLVAHFFNGLWAGVAFVIAGYIVILGLDLLIEGDTDKTFNRWPFYWLFWP